MFVITMYVKILCRDVRSVPICSASESTIERDMIGVLHNCVISDYDHNMVYNTPSMSHM